MKWNVLTDSTGEENGIKYLTFDNVSSLREVIGLLPYQGTYRLCMCNSKNELLNY